MSKNIIKNKTKTYYVVSIVDGENKLLSLLKKYRTKFEKFNETMLFDERCYLYSKRPSIRYINNLFNSSKYYMHIFIETLINYKLIDDKDAFNKELFSSYIKKHVRIQKVILTKNSELIL